MSLSTDILENIRKILEELAGKIYGTTYDDIIPSGNTPNNTIQRVMVETGSTELIIEIIYHLFVPFVYIEDYPEPTPDRAQKVRIA